MRPLLPTEESERALRKLVVHIGCPKGGSSAIQTGLRVNREALAAQGVSVPSHDLLGGSCVTGSQAAFFDTLVRDRQARELPNFGDLLDAQAADRGASTIVLSAENLCNPMGFERVFAAVRERFDVRIVMYVRRQDDFLESAWQQWEVKRGGSLLAWMIRCIGIHGNWLEILTPWADTFGDDHTVVRVYDRRRLAGGDVFTDFCAVLGVDASQLEPPGEVNVGLNPLLSRLVEGRDYLFDGPHDGEFYDALRHLAKRLVEKNGVVAPLFSPKEAEAVMARYNASNERFRKRFLPQAKYPLFPARRDAAASSEAGWDVASFERELLQLQIFNLHKQVKAMSDRLPARPPDHPPDPPPDPPPSGGDSSGAAR